MPRLPAALKAEILPIRARLRAYLETAPVAGASEATKKAIGDFYRHAAGDIELLLRQADQARKVREELADIKARLRSYRKYCAEPKASNAARKAVAEFCQQAADDIKTLLRIVDPPKKGRGKGAGRCQDCRCRDGGCPRRPKSKN